MEFKIINLEKVISDDLSLLNSVVALWRNVYTPIVGEVSFDSFYRSRIVSILHENGTIIGFSTNNFFYCGIEECRNHSYFAKCSENFKNNITINKLNVMTIEWITVNPLYQKRFSKVQYADILMGLQIEYMRNNNFDVIMGFSRTDIKADKLGKKFGAVSMGEIELFNIPCAIIYLEKNKIKNHPINKTQEILTEIYKKFITKGQAA